MVAAALAVHLHHPARTVEGHLAPAPPRSSAHPCRRPFHRSLVQVEPLVLRLGQVIGGLGLVAELGFQRGQEFVVLRVVDAGQVGRRHTCPPPCRPWSWPCLRRWPGCHRHGQSGRADLLGQAHVGLPPAVELISAPGWAERILETMGVQSVPSMGRYSSPTTLPPLLLDVLAGELEHAPAKGVVAADQEEGLDAALLHEVVDDGRDLPLRHPAVDASSGCRNGLRRTSCRCTGSCPG